jgi:hypothetical protein
MKSEQGGAGKRQEMGKLSLIARTGIQPDASSPQIFGQDCRISRDSEVSLKAKSVVRIRLNGGRSRI